MPKSSSIHIPIHVGRALSEKPLEGAIGDDTGNNISSLNPLFCELTATYWAWKNDTSSDYIGICHYRRFFTYKQRNIFSRSLDIFRFLKRKYLQSNSAHLCYHRTMGYSKEEEVRMYGYIAENVTAAFINYKQATAGSVVRNLDLLTYSDQ